MTATASPTKAVRPDLYRRGNSQGPSPIRIGADILPDASGLVQPSDPPQGLSTFSDPGVLPTKGRIWRLPSAVPLPDGLEAIPDQPPLGHVTIGPSRALPEAEFPRKLNELPWEDTGQKQR